MERSIDYRKQLEQRLEELSDTLNQFRVWFEHAISDLVLFNYALDVLEQGQAVLMLTESAALGRSALSNARSAFEACMDALLLTGSREDFDSSGALARACEILEHDDLLERRATADRSLRLERRQNAKPPGSVMEADADRWNEWAPGKGAILKRAYEQAEADGRWRRHWSGKSKRQIWSAVDASWGSESGLPEMADFFYGLLSIHGHPRPRAGARLREVDGDGKLTYSPRPQDTEVAAMIAQVACGLASAACARRREWEAA